MLALDPLSAHFVDFHLVVLGGVVALVLAAEALPPGEMLPVDGDAVVFVFLAGADESPAAFLFLEVEACGVGEEDEGEEGAGETEPGDKVELGLGVDVVVEDGGEEGSGFTGCSAETVGGGADGCREDLGGYEEGDAVGAELVEERGQEVHGLESVDVVLAGEEVIGKSWNNEEDEIGHETDNHHPLAAVELVVNEERGKVVTNERDADVDQVVEPASHDRLVAGCKNLDELVLEKLVAVEEDIVSEPGSSCGKQTWSKVGKGELERSNVVSSNVCLLLGEHELLGGRLHLVVTEVNQPERTNGWDGKRDAVGPLRNNLRVWWVGSRVEDEEQDDEDDLVEELAPTLHQESAGDLATTMKTIVLGGNLSGTDGVLHTSSSSHGVFTTDTNAVEEERPDVADNPTVLSDTPSGCEHQQTDKHDDGILDETVSATEPVTKNTNENLT